MDGYEWKLTSAGYARVPRARGRVVTLDAGCVRGSSWRVNMRPVRGGRAASFDDGRHQPATRTGRTASRRSGAWDK